MSKYFNARNGAIFGTVMSTICVCIVLDKITWGTVLASLIAITSAGLVSATAGYIYTKIIKPIDDYVTQLQESDDWQK